MLNRYFATYAFLHHLPDGLWVVVFALQVHQFGDGSLYGAIIAADDTSFLQLVACVVASHLYAPLQTLTDVDDDFAVAGAFAQGVDEPRALWGIAAAKGAHDDGAQVGRGNDVADEVLTDAWEQREDDDVVVQVELRLEVLASLW